MILYTVKNGLDYNFFYNLSILNFTKLVGIFAPICPLWFLTALFLMRVLTATSKFAPIILIFINVLIFMIFKAPREYNVFMSTTTLLCYPYFYIGIILKRFDLINKICNIIKTRLLWIKYMLLPAFSILIILGLLNGKTDMVQCNYGENGFIFFPISFLLCLIIVIFCYFYLNKYNTYITHTSSGTMMILAIHYPIISFIKNIIPLDSFLSKLTISFLIMIICYIGIIIAEKYCKILLGKSKFLTNLCA